MYWLKHLFSRRRLHSDLAEEIREHLEEKIDELLEECRGKKLRTRPGESLEM
jgi:hypothetical protein